MSKITFIVLSIMMILQPIKPEDLEHIKEAGTYPVEITADFNGVMKTEVIMITVEAPKTILKGNVGIDARDFTIPLNDLKQLNAAQLLKLSNAHAWDLKTGDKIAITNISVSDFQPETGVYKVTFSTVTTEISVYAMTQNQLEIKDSLSYLYPRPFWNENTLSRIVGIIFFFLVIPFFFFLVYLLFAIKQSVQVKRALYERVKHRK